MAQRKVIILMTAKFLQAAYIENDTARTVSIDGSSSFSYKTENDFSRFTDYITDTFNLSSLDGADMSVILVVCGAENGKANMLSAVLAKAKDNNMIRAEYVLPFIIIAKGNATKDSETHIKILDAWYTLKCDAESRTECKQSESLDTADITLSAQDFVPLFSADMSKFGVDEAELQKKNKIIAEFEGLTKELQEELLSTRRELKASLESKIDTTKELTDKSKEYNETLKNLLCIQSRYVVHWDYKPKENRSYSYPWGSSASVSANLRFEFERLCNDGDMVRNNEKIATVKVFAGKATVNYEEKISLYARSSGRIFYFLENSPDIGSNSCVVAVTCREDDAKAEVKKWLSSVLPYYLP